MTTATQNEIEWLVNQPMPTKNREPVSTSYPWGQTLVIERVSCDSRDLAAQSAEFSWVLSAYDGEPEKAGVFTVIGGLCGSFESCYYPKLRQLEGKLTKRASLCCPEKRLGEFITVICDHRFKFVLAIELPWSGGERIWLSTPIAITAKIENVTAYMPDIVDAGLHTTIKAYID